MASESTPDVADLLNRIKLRNADENTLSNHRRASSDGDEDASCHSSSTSSPPTSNPSQQQPPPPPADVGDDPRTRASSAEVGNRDVPSRRAPADSIDPKHIH